MRSRLGWAVPGRRAGVSGVGFLAASVLLAASAQLALKVGVVVIPAHVTTLDPAELLMQPAMRAPLLLGSLGIAAYGCSMLTWLLALERLPVSFAYPLLSTSFLLVLLGAAWLPMLAEPLSALRLAGVLLVMAGNGVVAWSAPGDSAVDGDGCVR